MIRIIFIIFISICLIDIKYIYARVVLSDEAVSYRNKGYEAQQNGDIDTAISWYQKSAGLDPKYAAPHNDLGILFETKGWLDRAEAEYKKALAIDSNYGKAHTNIALLYERKGEKEKAAFHWMKRYKLGRSGDPWTEEALTRLKKLDLLGDATENQLKKDKERQKEQDLKKEIEKEKTEVTPIPQDSSNVEGMEERLERIENQLDSSIRLDEENKERLSDIEEELLEESVKREDINEKLLNLDVDRKLEELDNKLLKIEKDITSKNKIMDIESSLSFAEDILNDETLKEEITFEEEPTREFTSKDLSSEDLEEAFYLAEDQIRRERLKKE